MSELKQSEIRRHHQPSSNPDTSIPTQPIKPVQLRPRGQGTSRRSIIKLGAAGVAAAAVAGIETGMIKPPSAYDVLNSTAALLEKGATAIETSADPNSPAYGLGLKTKDGKAEVSQDAQVYPITLHSEPLNDKRKSLTTPLYKDTKESDDFRAVDTEKLNAQGLRGEQITGRTYNAGASEKNGINKGHLTVTVDGQDYTVGAWAVVLKENGELIDPQYNKTPAKLVTFETPSK